MSSWTKVNIRKWCFWRIHEVYTVVVAEWFWWVQCFWWGISEQLSGATRRIFLYFGVASVSPLSLDVAASCQHNWHLWCVRIAVIHFLLFLKYYSSTSLDIWIQIWRPAPPRLRDVIDGAETIMASRLASPTWRHWRRENKYGVPPRLACGTPLTARRQLWRPASPRMREATDGAETITVWRSRLVSPRLYFYTKRFMCFDSFHIFDS